MPRPVSTEVAAAVVLDEHGRVLISRRHPKAHQGGLWEFPGGKVEPGEGVYSALCREIREELGITVESARPLIRLTHDYGDRRVLLDTWQVTAWSGTPEGREAQPIAWVPPSPEALRAYSFPAADLPIITAICLPDRYLITPEPDWNDVESFLGTLDGCLSRGIRLMQLRIKTMDGTGSARKKYSRLALKVLALCKARGAGCLLNGEPSLAREMGMHGVHLTSRQLLAEVDGTGRFLGSGFLVGASCHNRMELERACRAGVDFAVLGPVKATQTHPDAEPLTWARFSELARQAIIPVYALGGLSLDDLETAWKYGAQGIAAIRALWR